VNTLSAKADSFFEHPAQRLGYAQPARSRPGAIKDINRRVVVPIEHQTATAPVNANVQVLGHVLTAGGTLLARVVRGHLSNLTTGPFSLVGQRRDEGRPAYVANRLGKPGVPEHPLDVQAFHSDLAVARNQFVRNFVPVFVPQISYAGVQLANLATSLSSAAAALFLTGKTALSPAQFGQRIFEESRVSDFFALGRDHKMRQPNVEPNSGKDIANLLRFGRFAGQHNKPFIAFTLQRKGFDLSLHFPVQAEANRADMLNPEPITFQSYAVAVAREQDRVESVNTFKSRVTRLLPGFDSAKEARKSFVEPAERSLSAAEIEPLEISVLSSLVLKPAGLVFVAARDLPFVVEPLPLSQCIIIEAPVCLQHNHKLALLIGVGPKAEFVCVEHRLFPLLAFDVLTDCGFADVSHAPGVITSRPQRRKPGAKPRKFLAQYSTGLTFKPIGDLGNRKSRVTLNEEVDVIRHDFQGMNRQREFVRGILEKRFQTIRYRTFKHGPAVFWAPNKVKFKRENRRSVLCVTSHCATYTQSKYLIQRQTEKQAIPPLPKGIGSLA